MATPFPLYSKIRNRYCVAYYGPCAEYILQLIYVRSAIEKELPGLELYISCRDDYARFFPNKNKLIMGSEMDSRKKEVAYIRELRCNSEVHPIWQWVQESQLKLEFLKFPPKINITTKTCFISPHAILPTKPISDMGRLKKWISEQGFSISDDISKADWVVGTENEQLFLAAMRGVKTTLVPTGLGTQLYKKLFPEGELFA
jgi:hypothetical protein